MGARRVFPGIGAVRAECRPVLFAHFYSLAFGPLLYSYVRSLVKHGFRWRVRYWGHLVPVLLQTGLNWWLRFQPYVVRNDFWQHVHRPYTYRLEFIGTRV